MFGSSNMSYSINLTAKQEARLRGIVRDNQDNPHVLKRVYCILLKNEGQKNKNIVRLLDVHADTITDWTKLYLKQGLPGLLTFRFHRRRQSSLDPYRSRIRRIASLKHITTIGQLQQALDQRLSLPVEYSWLYRYCRKNGIYDLLRHDTGHET